MNIFGKKSKKENEVSEGVQEPKQQPDSKDKKGIKFKEKKTQEDKSAKKEKTNITEKLKKINKPKVKKTKPLPVFMAMDIGSREIKVMEATYKNNKLQVLKTASETLSNGIVFDGKIIEEEKVVNHVNNLLKSNAIKTTNVVLTINSTEIIQREITVPKTDEKDLLGLVTYEMAKFLPIDVSSYSVQYRMIEEFKNDNGVDYVKVNVCAVPRYLAKKYVVLLDKLGLKPIELNIHTNSVEKVVKLEAMHDGPLGKGCNVVIDMGHTGFNMMIFKDGEYLFNRLLEDGGSKLDDIIVRGAHVNPEQAEKIKKFNLSKISILDMYKSYSRGGFLDSGNADLSEQEIITQDSIMTVERFISNIDAVIKFYLSRDNDNKVDNVYIYGGSSRIRDIDKLLESMLNIKTQRLTSLSFVEGIDAEAVLAHINTIGAKIRL